MKTRRQKSRRPARRAGSRRAHAAAPRRRILRVFKVKLKLARVAAAKRRAERAAAADQARRRRAVLDAMRARAGALRAGLVNGPDVEIGRHVSLYGRRHWHYPLSRLDRGANEREAILFAVGTPPPAGASFSRVDYDNPGKALRVYGRVDRFRHDRESAPLRVARVVRLPGRKFRAHLTARVPVWRKS